MKLLPMLSLVTTSTFVFAGCSGGTSGTPISPGATLPLAQQSRQSRPSPVPTATSSYQVLHNFGVGFDGNTPVAGLINVNGTLYGTTYGGGAYGGSSGGLGTVFSITTTGTESVVYSFGQSGPYDGAHPWAGLTALNGRLYGTTNRGGAYTGSGTGLGTVFSVTTTGSESVLHNFAGSDGQWPLGNLIVKSGKLYGTTSYGGAYQYCFCGTVFSITPTGKQRVLHSFGYGTDARIPQAGLLNVHGTLYGTTAGDGVTHYGTVFTVNPRTGEETVLYNFKGGSDGADPLLGSLILVKGVLYGTTPMGGKGCPSNSHDPGCGTVFAVTTSGSEHVVYRFKGGSDGAQPWNSLFAIGNKLYGTTNFGGNTGCYQNLGCGTVFSVTPSGRERLLHVFTGGSDGENPTSNLIDVNGVLYGTTSGAGNSSDWGTVFSLTP